MNRITPTLCVLASWIFFSSVAPAQLTEPPSADPQHAGSGALFRLTANGTVPLPVAGIDVDLHVSGMVIDATLTQRFENPAQETIDVLYVFPLPSDAAVYAMEMRIGDRRIVAEVHEKEQAQRIYDQAKEDGKKAALVAQHRPNLFRTSAANVLPGEAIEIELRLVQKAERVGRTYRARFPLTITPRFSPPGHEGLQETNTAATAAKVRVVVDGASRLEHIETPLHEMNRARRADAVVLEPRDGEVTTDRDFLLTWTPEKTALPEVAAFVETRGDERFALIHVLPPDAGSELGSGLPTETLFVIDVSSSMRGPSIAQARQALGRALARLRPGDRFNVLSFNDQSEAYADVFQDATPESLENAAAWVGRLQATGGTAIYPALSRGLALIGGGSPGYASRLIFLTDGAVANEQEVLRAVAERIGETRLHAIGIGAAPNDYLMRKMAWHGRGLCEFVASIDQANNRIDDFFDRLERPVWTDLTLTWDGVSAGDVAPGRLPDLHLGEPLVLSARLEKQSGGVLTIGGWSNGGWVERSIELDRAAVENPSIARTWARARVGTLMDSLVEGAEPGLVRDGVVELGMTFGLVTAYTSLVAVERYAGELSEGLVPEARNLPNTGTLEPLKRRLALMFALAGLLGLYALRSRG